MNCREKILSEDYMSILLDYVPEEANQEDEAFCYQQVDGTLGIYYLDRSAVLPLSPVNYLYRYLPQLFCLGAFPAAGSRTFRTEPLEGSGILAQQRPPLELTGRRVVMAFIDTGISYENPVFRYSDGSSRILAIWDQTDQSGQSPEGFLYGTEYVREQIDRALELEDPHSLVPEKDEIGHGTAVASVAAGSRLEEGSLFTGAAPALKHPNWNMGAKITIDSATLMNKGLELIEAVWLFGLPPEKIQIVVQRQSIVHSAVQYSDNSIIAQLGVPDMRIPIQYALTYPARVPGVVPELDFTTLKLLTFDVADEETFRCLAACKKAIKKGGLGPCAANGANEEAVKLFLEDKIGFLDIGRLVEAVVDSDSFGGDYSLADVYECDRMARAFVRAHL